MMSYEERRHQELVEYDEAQKAKLEKAKEALQNAKGFLDTPISRRRNAGDSFYEEVVKSINDALETLKGDEE